ASDGDQKVYRQAMKLTKWGTMIELPRACLIADQFAGYLDFISFGTNDLTQTTLGVSRDDGGKFIPKYIEERIIPNDPFEILDRDGVGQLVSMAVAKARSVNKNIEIGICGEHGGEPSSIEFFSEHKFDSVSCSPFRVPVDRLAVANSAGKSGGKKLQNAKSR